MRTTVLRALNTWLGDGRLLCIPTTPTIAPPRGVYFDRSDPHGDEDAFYPRTLALTSIAGLASLPQVTLPLCEFEGAPHGVSLLAAHNRDEELLAATRAAMG